MNGAFDFDFDRIDYLARVTLEAVRDYQKKSGAERREPMRNIKRKLTKEQYQNAQNGNWDGIFMEHEVCGYGVYGETLHYDHEKDEYYVEFYLGETCD